MTEEWKPVVGFEGLYEVSSHGRVRSLGRTVRCRGSGGAYRNHVVRPKLLKPWRAKLLGYRLVGLYVRSSGGSKHNKTMAVHRLVLESFVGSCPDGIQCCHKDGDPTNNRLENLRWDTPKANMDDRERHGRTKQRGSSSTLAKLTEEDIPIIRERLKNTTWGAMSAIARDYGVDTATIRDIRDRRTWNHVS